MVAYLVNKGCAFHPDVFWAYRFFNTLIANPTKWSNTLKEFVAKLPTNCLSVFDHFVGLALKELTLVSGWFNDT